VIFSRETQREVRRPLPGHLRRADYCWLALFSFLLFGYAMVGGRPLTMHEAVLPQSAREMLADGDWIVPKSGGRPWLERPPLPQWITAAVAGLLGGADREWVVRLPAALMGSAAVLLVGWMAAGWFGRTVGLLSGFLLATMFEFTSYAWLAEQDIYLCALVALAIALFARLEFFQVPEAADGRNRFLGGRPRPVLAFFLSLGLTNLAKGVLFGPAMVLIPVAGFLAWNADRRQIVRYVWLWGWLLCIAIAAAWPIAAWLRYPDVLELWRFDHLGRLSGEYTAINQPVWYYVSTLTWEMAPWTLFAVLGLWRAAGRAFRERNSPERFLWCWAILPVVVLSLAAGKHHHYMLHLLAPWAVLAALALVQFRDWIFARPEWAGHRLAAATLLALSGGAVLWAWRAPLQGPRWLAFVLLFVWAAWSLVFAWALWRAKGGLAMGAALAAITGVYWAIFTLSLPPRDQVLEDTVFLRQVRALPRGGTPLLVNSDLNSMDAFRILFYLDGSVRALHNLTYLQDDRIQSAEVLVITRARDESTLAKLGGTEVLLQSRRSRRETSPADRLTLFRLRFRPDLPRAPAPSRISPMQAMSRQEGPYLVPAPRRD
jgi:4-amino-4-deoxy-L-arabinose transferase-like glycosyltransferase